MTEPRVLIPAAAIERRVGELAAEISRDYADAGELVLVGILKGAFVFLADLGRHLTIPRAVEFMAVASYGKKGSVNESVRLVTDLQESIVERHVLLVEDIVDTGHTLAYLIELLQTRHPASIKTCALVRKPARHKVEVSIDYLGFEIPDVWVVGYGLDYAERWRMLPFIGAVET